MQKVRKKRSKISKQRGEELSRNNAVYVIMCGMDGCPCGNPKSGCGRGFFSLFIQVVYGIEFSRRWQIPYHVGYGNVSYSYSEQDREDQNFWNYYFEQPLKRLTDTKGHVINDMFEIYPLRIWSRNHLRRMNQEVIKNLNFKTYVRDQLDQINKLFSNNKVLAVHIRVTDHIDEIAPVSWQTYIKTIDQEITNYDKLFVATDDIHILKRLREKYKGKLIYNDVQRSADAIAVHANPNIYDRYQLGLDVIKDCYALSISDMALLVHSNISYSALLFNPELNYKLLEKLSSKKHRLKTLFLYYLNAWGIRKW